MPNKHKNKKLKTKLLISGKLNKKENVIDTYNYLAQKSQQEQEDINFDYENDKNTDFEKLEPDDDNTKGKKHLKGARPSLKRKLLPGSTESTKKAKITASQTPSTNSPALPKKSKKNKYFFLAHPDELDKKEDILSSKGDAAKNKFVIDEEKLKLNLKKQKKAKPTNSVDDQNESGSIESIDKKSKKQKKSDNLWSIEQCSDEEKTDDQVEQPVKLSKTKKKSQKIPILNIEDLDKSFKINKSVKRLEDGTLVEVFKPDILDDEDDDDDDENDEEEDEDDENQQEDQSDEDETTQHPTEDENKNDDNFNDLNDKLKASRFRYLNEMLYTQPSDKSFEYFTR